VKEEVTDTLDGLKIVKEEVLEKLAEKDDKSSGLDGLKLWRCRP